MRTAYRNLTALLMAGLLCTGAPAAPSAPEPARWQATWISPAEPLWSEPFALPLGMPRMLRDVTLGQTLHTSVGGERLRLVLSNEFSASPLHVGRVTVHREGAAQEIAVRFQDSEQATVAPGARLLSDPIDLPTRAGERLQVDLYLPQPTQLAGFHWDAHERTLLIHGDKTPPTALSARAFVSELLVQANRPAATVVAIGDSLTDGNGSTPGQDQRWPDHLARRMAPQGVAVLNAGISGNRLLQGGMGEAALARFERDVLGHQGVRAAIVLLGINDIGWPGSPFGRTDPAPTLDDLARGFRQLVAQAHARGVRVVGATLPPFEDALKGTPLEGHYSPRKETQRLALNAWIRDSGAFDAVLDFDALLRDPARPSRLRKEFDSGDHLHPNDAGYRAMADAIDPAVLLGGSVVEARP
jgi:lysophospholipase L1-like esterase